MSLAALLGWIVQPLLLVYKRLQAAQRKVLSAATCVVVSAAMSSCRIPGACGGAAYLHSNSMQALLR
jgi:hypothetical protein